VSAPRVSVLLPVRNAEATLAECLASLSAQTLADHEVIAVDDHSTDGSRALLAGAAGRDHRLRVLDNPGRGLVAALNAAFAAAPNPGMRSYVDWLNRLLDHEAIRRDLYVESPLAHPTVMMRASLLAGLGGYRAFDGPEDYDLWLRAAAAGARFATLPEALLDWRDGPARLSRTDPRYAAARFRAVKIQALEAGPLPAGRPAVVWGAGPIGKGWARALGARGHRVAAFVEVHRGRLGQRIHGAPVVPVEEAAATAGALHLAAVGQPGARDEIRRQAARLGLFEGTDLIAVA